VSRIPRRQEQRLFGAPCPPAHYRQNPVDVSEFSAVVFVVPHPNGGTDQRRSWGWRPISRCHSHASTVREKSISVWGAQIVVVCGVRFGEDGPDLARKLLVPARWRVRWFKLTQTTRGRRWSSVEIRWFILRLMTILRLASLTRGRETGSRFASRASSSERFPETRGCWNTRPTLVA
jgi:hypothetical protein